jgi:hypothetical protein
MEQIDESHAGPTQGIGVGIDWQHTGLALGTLGHAPEAPVPPEAPLVVAPLPAAPLVAIPLALPVSPLSGSMSGTPQLEAARPIAIKNQRIICNFIVGCKGRSRHLGERA